MFGIRLVAKAVGCRRLLQQNRASSSVDVVENHLLFIDVGALVGKRLCLLGVVQICGLVGLQVVVVYVAFETLEQDRPGLLAVMLGLVRHILVVQVDLRQVGVSGCCLVIFDSIDDLDERNDVDGLDKDGLGKLFELDPLDLSCFILA